MATPYFYIIKEISTGKRYAGVKFAKGCSPEGLLVTYLTSSKIVKNLLIKDPNSFIIERIKTFETKEEAIIYEERFLKKVKANKSDRWYNQSISGSINPEYLKKIYNDKYNVDNPSQLREIKDKVAQTCISKFGSRSKFESVNFEQQRKTTMLSRYGVEYSAQSPEILEKIKLSYLEKYGVDNPSKIEKNRKLQSKLMKDKNKIIKVCQHCGKESNIGNYSRWHGDNCRNK